MRNDLTLVCRKCRLRLPSTEKRCPRCARDLFVMRDLSERSFGARIFGGVHPYRDLVLYAPVVPSLAIGVWGAVDMTTFELSFVPVIQALFLFDSVMLAMGLLWLLWAAFVVTASTLWNAFRSPPLRVVLMPIVRPEIPKPLWTLPKRRGGEPIERRDLVPAVVLFALGLALSIAGFTRGAWPGALAAALVGVFSTILVVLGSMILAWIVWWARFSASKVSAALAEIRSDEALDLSRVRHGRAHASGIARAGEQELIAPLSGKPCVAFRLFGRMGDVEIDDALVAPMHLESEKGMYALYAQRWIAALPTPSITKQITSEQRARVRRFIESRGLHFFSEDLELGESIVDEGDVIEVWGVLAMSSIPTYRDRQEAFELADSDGKPVVLALKNP